VVALDTNVLVRYLTADDAEQAGRAAALIDDAVARGESLFISHVVLCEVTWVLARAYRLARPDLVDVPDDSVRTAQFVVEDPAIARRALSRFAAGAADFADDLIAERAAGAGCRVVVTFDRKLLRERGFEAP
jgi:predicted nucleic-acid-binding protein